VGLVVGEPGIGKSSLLEQVTAAARDRGFEVAWGRAWELGGAPAYWPWIEALRALPESRELERLLTALEGRGGEAADAFQLCARVTRYLEGATERAPLLLVFDDLHAADPSSLELCEFVARRLGGMRLALMGSHRDVEARLRPEIDAPLSRLGRYGEVLTLDRLGREHVAALLRESLGRDDAEVARMIHDASDGNPLFAKELIRLLKVKSGASASVPSGVRAVIRERLALLAPATVALLQAAAVVGREFDVDVAAAVAGVTDEALGEAALDASNAELIARVETGRFRFSHALVAETLALDLSPTVRARSHRRAAEALEARHSGDPSPPLERIAHHYLQAGAEVADRAALAAERAASAAAMKLAFADAAQLYESALAAHNQAAPADARRRAELLIAQSASFSRAGNRERSEAACLAAAELARGIGDSLLLARSALALGAEVWAGQRDAQVTRLLEEALDAMPEGDDPWRARVMARLASARQPAPDLNAPMQLAREAIAMARRIGDDEVMLEVLHSAIGALVDFAPAAERAPLNEEARDRAMAAGDRPRALRALTRLCFDYLELADAGGFEKSLETFRLVSGEARQPRYEAVELLFRAMRADWEGRFADADALEAEVLRLQGDEAAALTVFRAFGKSWLRNDDSVLAEAFERARPYVGPQSAMNTIMAPLLALARGDHEEAERLLGDDLRIYASQLRAAESGAEIAWRLRHRALAETVRPVLATRSGTPLMMTGAAFILYGVTDHLSMRMAAVLGDWEAVDRHAEAALELCRKLGATPIEAAVRRDWAIALGERGRPEDLARARDLAARSARAFERLGLAQPPEPVAAAVEEEPRPQSTALSLQLEGEYWTVRGYGELCRLKDNRGLHMLAQLVEADGRELHVLDLSGALAPVDGGDSGEVLDQEARAAYERRVRELREELEEAESWNDAGRRARLEEELDMLRAELSRAFGLGGRQRRGSSAVERARVNVRRRLDFALRRIEEVNPKLGGEIRSRLRTGTHCSFG